MIYVVNKDLDSILLGESSWILIQDGISYELNPFLDHIKVNNNLIEIEPRHQVYLKIKNKMLELSPKTSEVPVSIHSLESYSCTAFYETNFNQYEKPREISMDLSSFCVLDDWKMSLAHEFYHFIIFEYNMQPNYEDFIKIKKIEQLTEIFDFLFPIVIASIWVLSFVSAGTILGLIPALFIGLIVLYLALDVLSRWFFLKFSYLDRCLNYFYEYECDRFAYDLFPEINLRNTYLNKPTHQNTVYDTHPSNSQRYISLISNERNYSFFISWSAFNKAINWQEYRLDLTPNFRLIIKSFKIIFKNIKYKKHKFSYKASNHLIKLWYNNT